MAYLIKLYFLSETYLFTFNMYAAFTQVWIILQYQYKFKMRTEWFSPNLCVDQFHQLVQQLFSRNAGIEHAGNVFNIWLKGPRWRAQVVKEVCDHISQGLFTIIVCVVMVKSLVLHRNHNKNIINKLTLWCSCQIIVKHFKNENLNLRYSDVYESNNCVTDTTKVKSSNSGDLFLRHTGSQQTGQTLGHWLKALMTWLQNPLRYTFWELMYCWSVHIAGAGSVF